MSDVGLYDHDPETDLPLIDRMHGLVKNGCLVTGPAGTRPFDLPEDTPRIGDHVTYVDRFSTEVRNTGRLKVINTTVARYWGGEAIHGERYRNAWTPCTEAAAYEGSGGFHLLPYEEGTVWLRGHHAPDSAEVYAMLAAVALTREASGR